MDFPTCYLEVTSFLLVVCHGGQPLWHQLDPLSRAPRETKTSTKRHLFSGDGLASGPSVLGTLKPGNAARQVAPS